MSEPIDQSTDGFPLGFVPPLLIALFIGCVMARRRHDAMQAAPGGILTPA